MKTNGKNGNDGRNERPPASLDERIIIPRGDYQILHSFHKAEVVFDITFRFVHKFFAKGDRTVDQMIQAARSGKKNLLEGSKAASTSNETELYREFVETRPPEVIANIALCLIHQANYLIDRQFLRLERGFLEQGGLRERMTRLRLSHRGRETGRNPAPSVPSVPSLPSSRGGTRA